MTSSDLSMQNFSDELTRLFDFRHGERAVDLFAVASRPYHTHRPQNRNVL